MSRISPKRLSVWLAYVVVLTTLTHLPKSTVGRFPIRIWDKLSHTLAYAVLGWLSWWAFASRPAAPSHEAAQRRPGDRVALDGADVTSCDVGTSQPCRTRGRVALGFAALLLFAAADEYTQQWVGRDPTLTDWIANALGVALGLGGTMTLKRLRVRR